ncbi:hypothetical protein O6H91_10G029700 [Diphasiastrum complanatum]|uniref:Uncharacterized protein n=1 Tax=Diphasiastrum complanatum TaxID=34168 RepID=A0ACC2CGG2_DIPCM|nr:hypothetical protein O6H91_10G029700 [Diphasiastrum complanatum]
MLMYLAFTIPLLIPSRIPTSAFSLHHHRHLLHHHLNPLNAQGSEESTAVLAAKTADIHVPLRWKSAVALAGAEVAHCKCFQGKHPFNFTSLEESEEAEAEEEKEEEEEEEEAISVRRVQSRQSQVEAQSRKQKKSDKYIDACDSAGKLQDYSGNLIVDVDRGNDMGANVWAKFGQSINISGILSSIQVIVKDPEFLLPHVSVPDISWVNWSVLRHCGFKGVVFDKDNTLTAPYQSSVWPPLSQSLQECMQVFEGNVAILSNSAGLQQFDPDGLQAKALEASLGISVIRHRTKKPAGTAEDVVKHFGCDPSLLVMVGDRCLTDVVYGNKNGLLTIHTALLSEINEPLIVNKVRKMEDKIVQWWISRGLIPPSHRLMCDKFELIKDPGCW